MRHGREAPSSRVTHARSPGCVPQRRRSSHLSLPTKGDLIMRTCLTSRALWSLAALVLVLVLGAALSAPAQAPAPIQIAWAGPLTGDAAQFGQGYLKGIQLAFEEWNAKGGVLGGRKFVVVTEDDGCDPMQAGTVATKIADDSKNVVFIGHVCSGTTIAGAPI